MDGDGLNGLAQTILIVMVLLVLGGAALFAFAGSALTRKLTNSKRHLATALMALVGAGLGWMLVMATVYESSWSPPPELRLATAPGFDAPVVILLEDPQAPQTVEWRDSGLPFTSAVAEISVPPGGIVRVRSFGLMAGHGGLKAIWSDGVESFGAGGGPGPPGMGANTYMIIERPNAPSPESLQSLDPAAVAAYVAQRERVAAS